jgi:hypothetical protein
MTADKSLQQMSVLAIILSMDIARLVRHRRADNSILWMQVATSAEQILAGALAESAGPRDSDGILQAAHQTLLKFLCEKGEGSETIAA